jgi:hypothetical protein
MAKHCTACNREFAEALKACPYCEPRGENTLEPQEFAIVAVEGEIVESASASTSDSPFTPPPYTPASIENFGAESINEAAGYTEPEPVVEISTGGKDQEPAHIPAEEPDGHCAAASEADSTDNDATPITDPRRALLAMVLADPLYGEGSIFVKKVSGARGQNGTGAGFRTRLRAGLCKSVEEASRSCIESAAASNHVDAPTTQDAAWTSNGFSSAAVSDGLYVRTAASTDLLPENDGGPATRAGSNPTPASEPELPISACLPDHPPEVPPRAWLWHGTIGAVVGLATGLFLLWLFGFRLTSGNAAFVNELSGTLHASGMNEAGSPHRTDSGERGEFDLCFRRSIKMAEEQHFKPAALALATALKARENEKSLQADKKNPAEDAGSLKIVGATGEELTRLWNLEQRLLDEGFLNAQQRDAVAALNKLLEDDKRYHESLRSLAARFGAKPSSSAPAALILKEVDSLASAKQYAEREAARLGVALEKTSGAQKRMMQEAASRAQELEQRLAAREAQLLAAERKIVEFSAAKQMAPARPSPPAEPVPSENRPVARDSALAYQHYARGIDLYESSRYSEAEVELYRAVERDEEDARYHYFLGLAQQAQGKREPAARSFRRGAQLEQGHQPSPVFVALALTRAKKDGLQVLNTYRQ